MQAEKDKEKFPPFLSILWKLFAFVCVEPVDFSNLSHNDDDDVAFGDEKK
jgi:hypothetical protein